MLLGIVFLLLATIILCYRQFSTQKRYDQLASSDRQKIGELVKQITDMKKELKELVEYGDENTTAQRLTATGIAKCDQPLMSPLGNVPCIYYKMSVTARWNESYVENNVTKTKKRSKVVASEEKFTNFKIEDNTGFVNVDPTDGSFEDSRKSVDKSEASSKLNISSGNFQLNPENLDIWNGGSPQTIVYEYKEEVIDIDRKITVVGTLCDKMGDLVIKKHEKTPVIISTKSSDEMVKDTKSNLKAQLIATVIFTLLGVGLIIGHIIIDEERRYNFDTGMDYPSPKGRYNPDDAPFGRYNPDDAPFGDDGLAYHIKYCDSGVGEACNRAGNFQTRQKKHSEALSLYKKGCELNAEAACYNLAHKYEYGSGTAVEYLQKSCNLRFGKACTELSVFYYNRDKARSFEYAKRACDYKDGNGCDKLGTFYLLGNGVEPNRNKAMKLFRKGCKLGGEDACSSYKFHQD